MKKIVTYLAALALMCSATSVMAADFKVSVPNTDKIVENIYDEEIETVDVTEMMTQVSKLTDSKDVIQQLAFESDSDAPVVVTLKLEIPEDKSAQGNTAIDYIDFKVVAADGSILFEDSEDREKGANSREVVLGILNETGEPASQVYDIYMSANDAMSMSELVSLPTDIKWTLVLNVAEKDEVLNENQKTITVAVDKVTDKDGGKVAEGIYGLMGKGICTITSADGQKAVSFYLSENEAEAKYASLKKGDTIVVNGGADAKLQLINPPAGATVTTQDTQTKENPKTGDNAPLTLVGAAAAAAMAMMVYTTRNRRKED